METELKIGSFQYKERKYIQITDIEGIEIEVQGRVDYIKDGAKIKTIASQVSIKPVGIVDGIRFERLRNYAQKRAEEIVSQAFDTHLNFQMFERRIRDEATATEERLNQWYRNTFGKDRKQF